MKNRSGYVSLGLLAVLAFVGLAVIGIGEVQSKVEQPLNDAWSSPADYTACTAPLLDLTAVEPSPHDPIGEWSPGETETMSFDAIQAHRTAERAQPAPLVCQFGDHPAQGNYADADGPICNACARAAMVSPAAIAGYEPAVSDEVWPLLAAWAV